MPSVKTKTFYDILGVTQGATQAELRKAWLALARKYHPDKTGGHKGSEDKLKIVNEAYDTLKRPEKRKEYDESLAGPFAAETPFRAGAASGSPHNGSAHAGRTEFDGDLSDIFGDMFGQTTQGRQHGLRGGADLETYITVSLREAAEGAKKSLRLPSESACQSCAGSGAARGTMPQQCPHCGGNGHISSGSGSLFVMSQMCPLCRGRGEIIPTPCPACGGTGSKTESRTLSVTIPPGARTGTRLRLNGQGQRGDPGARNGDLFIVVRIEESEIFQLKRNDLVCEVPITFTQAALGGTVEVPTLHGKARLTIPAGTQSGAILRMRDQGFPALNGGRRGDQLVTVILEIPRKVSPEQRKTIQNLHEADSLDSYPKHRSYAASPWRWCKH
ncbi:MAG: J domain-containing protein [Candidatus Hydrogenedentales bacterium]